MEEPVREPRPPVAAQRLTVLTKHGDSRIDPYFWLRQKANPEVIAYLQAENAYADAVIEIELDGNELAVGHDYFELGFVERSPDENILAYAVDLTGDELHEVRFRDLSTGHDLEDVLSDVYYGSAWSADSRTFFYVRPDKAMRPYQVWRHTLGTTVDKDVVVLQEDDERFELSVELTKTERYIVFTSSSQVTSESRYLRSDEPESTPLLIEARRHGIEYSVDHQEDHFLILTNDGAHNFRLVAAPVERPGREAWEDVVPEREGVRMNAMDVHIGHVVLGQRSDGLQRLEVLNSASGELYVVDQPDPAYTAFAGSNPVYDSSVMRFFYTSLNAPWSTVDFDMDTRERTVVKEQPVPGGYDRADYVTDRLWATSADGTRVPMSIVHRRGLQTGGANPALLYGYGAYELPSDPMFDATRLSLLDRGFVFAIAHVRGGGEMGRQWYEDGKFLNKTNTFDDFIACAVELIDRGYTNPRQLAIRGRSAGGLLIGAVVNARPDLFACAVAQVPFVDALTTMLDESIPLTVNEYEEWGDPNDPEFYEYMKSYSPYDNVHRAGYPAMLVTAGLNDPRVPFWEPAKWVAKLRSMTLSARPIILKTDLGSGHSGPSGRYQSWREEAFVSAFVVDQLQAS